MITCHVLLNHDTTEEWQEECNKNAGELLVRGLTCKSQWFLNITHRKDSVNENSNRIVNKTIKYPRTKLIQRTNKVNCPVQGASKGPLGFKGFWSLLWFMPVIPSSGEPGRTVVNSRLCERKPGCITKWDPVSELETVESPGERRSENQSELGSGKWPQRTHGFFPVTLWAQSGPASPCSVLNHGNLA